MARRTKAEIAAMRAWAEHVAELMATLMDGSVTWESLNEEDKRYVAEMVCCPSHPDVMYAIASTLADALLEKLTAAGINVAEVAEVDDSGIFTVPTRSPLQLVKGNTVQ